MRLAVDDRSVRTESCPACGQAFEHVTGFLRDENGAYAVYFAACHGHPGHEAQIDVVLGSWGTDDPVDDHVTFSCRLRASGAMADDAPLATSSDSPLLGTRLTREAALAHPRIGELWAVVDYLAEQDPTIRRTVYGGDGP